MTTPVVDVFAQGGGPGGNALVVLTTAGTGQNDLLIGIVHIDGDDPVTSVTLGGLTVYATPWTRLIALSAGAGKRTEIWYAVVNGTLNTGTVHFLTSADDIPVTAGVVAITGGSAAQLQIINNTWYGASPDGTGGSRSFVAPKSDTLVLGFAGYNDTWSGTISEPGYTSVIAEQITGSFTGIWSQTFSGGTAGSFTTDQGNEFGYLLVVPNSPSIKRSSSQENAVQIKRGSTSQIVRVKLFNSIASDGTGRTGLNAATSGLKITYSSDGAVATPVTPVNMAVGSWVSGGFIEIDAINLPGWYEVGLPDAALASSAKRVQLAIFGASNLYAYDGFIDLVSVDPQDATAFGISRLDAAVSSRAATADITSAVETAGAATQPAKINLQAVDANGAVPVNNLSAIVNAVWDEDLTNHETEGSTGATLLEASLIAGQPWTRIY
jgi:hypothetical protein